MIYGKMKNRAGSSMTNMFFKKASKVKENVPFRIPTYDRVLQNVPIIGDHVAHRIADTEADINAITDSQIPPDLKAASYVSVLKKLKNLNKARKRVGIFKINKPDPAARQPPPRPFLNQKYLNPAPPRRRRRVSEELYEFSHLYDPAQPVRIQPARNVVGNGTNFIPWLAKTPQKNMNKKRAPIGKRLKNLTKLIHWK